MWVWVLIIFAVGGAIIGLLGSKDGDGKEGALGGCLAGLFTGGSCLFQILITGLSILLIIWLLGFLFG